MKLQHLFYVGCIVSATLVGCGADDDDPDAPSAGQGGSSGRGGSAGKGGSAGSSGKGGSSGRGGTTGKGGTGGDAGAGMAGEGGDENGGTGGSSPGDAGSGGEGAEPGCTDFTAFVTDLVNDQTRENNAPVKTEGITFCEDPQDPDAFDGLF